MGSHRRAAAIALATLLSSAGCTLPPLRTPTPRPSPAAAPSATASLTIPVTPTTSARPTADVASLPSFGAGELIVTVADALRVRQLPGFSSPIVTGLLPAGAELQVVMGPILVQEMGWYLVVDADAADPEFEEGWIASGFEPEPYLRSSEVPSPDASPFVASFAQTGEAEYGPIEIGDGDYLIRWIAVDPERVRCQFGVALAAGPTEPVPAIRATVGNAVDVGTLQPGSFSALGVRGQVFLSVESDCAWSLVVVRAPAPEDDPAPTSPP